MEIFFGALLLFGLIAAFSSGSTKKTQIDNLKSQIEITKDSIEQADNFYNFISEDSTIKNSKTVRSSLFLNQILICTNQEQEDMLDTQE